MSRVFRSKKYWWVNCREKFFFLIFLALFVLITPTKEGEVAVAAFVELPLVKQETLPIPSPAPYPINISKTRPPNDISAYAIYIVDIHSGVPLYAKNENVPLPPASTTKLMTALVALDLYKPSDIVTVKESTAGGQRMDLVLHERITVENLLYGMLIHSGNDAAEQLAFHHQSGYGAFIAAMNEKAKVLHLKQSSFTNPAGWDELDHKMSAKDLARLAKAAVEHPLIAKMVAIPEITISDVDHVIFHKLKTTNQLLGKIPGVSGIKTGYTQEAGQNLVTMVQRDGKKILFVVLRSQDRFADTTLLIDWVFKNHQWITYGV
jgi:D-alanyl-D-alanine carboxypeptidase (penicillin-binding protein 5/6)